MEPTFFSFKDKGKGSQQALGAIGYRQGGSGFNGSLLHDFELLVLVVCAHNDDNDIHIEHCMNGEVPYQIRYIGKDELKNWVASGENREIIHCFFHGEVIWDIGGEVKALRQELADFGGSMSESRKLKEFAKFLQTYVEAKQYTRNLDYMDAYFSVLQALKYYARIELIDQGIAPDKSVWEQIRSFNTVVYKLFNELTDSQETLEQRIELVLLACEFFVMSRMEDCCSVLLRILGSRKEPWSIQELIVLPELAHVKEELPMVIRKLVYRSLVKQTAHASGDHARDGREIRYWV
ncbi:nucleotidyltransferase-like protein [Paenibacillus sp. M1]|uniref:Nucleotidyltransferase-like protein n=1 Tax=Paenibacillus haidiansis TaxID=1574488 RepID=A0ABU7W063_9BACL